MSTELWEDIRDGIVEALKIENTLAGSQVRIGRIIPLDNPFSSNVTPEDAMPLLIVDMRRVSFEDMSERGRNDQYTRRPEYQIDGYIAHDQAAADTAGLPVDEWITTQIDLFAAQVSQVIGKYRRFRGDSDPTPALRLRSKVTGMWVLDFVKNDMPGDQDPIIGVFSMRIEAQYVQARIFESIDDLAGIDNEITTGQNGEAGSITKDVTAAEP